MLFRSDPEKTKALVGLLLEQDKSKSERKVFMEEKDLPIYQEINQAKTITELKNTPKVISPIVFNEPYNPVSGEIFVGENIKKAKYVMARIQSKDPRFLESTDIVKTGLTLKRDTKEALIVSVGKNSRFFYNAVNIEGMPQKTNIVDHSYFNKQVLIQRKEKEIEIGL